MWNTEMAKCIGIWLNEHSRKKGWVIMKRKCVSVNECGYDMIRGKCERWEQSTMSLSICYQNVLTYESVKLMKRLVSMNTIMKVLRLTYLILMMRWAIICWSMMSSYMKP